MAAAVLLLNVLFMIFPLLVDRSEDNYNDEFILNPEQLEFLPFESDFSFIHARDITKVIVILVLICYSFCQWMQIRSEIDAFQTVENQFAVNHEEAMDIERFYLDAEQQFLSMERQSMGLQKRFQKADTLSKETKLIDKTKEDIDFVQSSWCAQFSSFDLLDLEVDGTTISDREIEDKLSEIKEMFDKELDKIDCFMEEDIMELDEVLRRKNRNKSWAEIMEM